jgi:hypothetical protein
MTHQATPTRQLERQAQDLQRHHRLGPRHRVVEAAVGRKQQARRQGQRQGQQVHAQLGRHLGRCVGEGDEGLRKREQQAARQGERDRHPHGLVQLFAGGLEALGALQLADDRAGREHHAHQADEDGDVGRRADRERGQVGGGVARDECRVDGGEQNHRDLAHEHRPGQRHDATRIRPPMVEARTHAGLSEAGSG